MPSYPHESSPLLCFVSQKQGAPYQCRFRDTPEFAVMQLLKGWRGGSKGYIREKNRAQRVSRRSKLSVTRTSSTLRQACENGTSCNQVQTTRAWGKRDARRAGGRCLSRTCHITRESTLLCFQNLLWPYIVSTVNGSKVKGKTDNTLSYAYDTVAHSTRQ